MAKPYERLQSQGRVKIWPTPGSKFNIYCLLSCLEHSTLILCLWRPTVTLDQGQGHRHEHIIMPPISLPYRHAKFECYSLILSEILQVKT